MQKTFAFTLFAFSPENLSKMLSMMIQRNSDDDGERCEGRKKNTIFFMQSLSFYIFSFLLRKVWKKFRRKCYQRAIVSFNDYTYFILAHGINTSHTTSFPTSFTFFLLRRNYITILSVCIYFRYQNDYSILLWTKKKSIHKNIMSFTKRKKKLFTLLFSTYFHLFLTIFAL